MPMRASPEGSLLPTPTSTSTTTSSAPLRLPPTNGTIRRFLTHLGTVIPIEARQRKGAVRTVGITTWQIKIQRKPLYREFVDGGRAVTRISVRVPANIVVRPPSCLPRIFLEYADPNPISEPTAAMTPRGGKGKFAQWMGGARQPLQQRIQNKQNGVGRQRRPWVGE